MENITDKNILHMRLKRFILLFLLFLPILIFAQLKSVKGNYNGVSRAYIKYAKESESIYPIEPGANYYLKIGTIQTKLYDLPNPNNGIGGFANLYYGNSKVIGDTLIFTIKKYQIGTKRVEAYEKDFQFRRAKVPPTRKIYRFLIKENEWAEKFLFDLDEDMDFYWNRAEDFKMRKLIH